VASRGISSIDSFDNQPPRHLSAGSTEDTQPDIRLEPTTTPDQPDQPTNTPDSNHIVTQQLTPVNNHHPTPTPAVPITHHREHQWRKALTLTLFCATFTATISIWWFNTPANTIKGQTNIFLATGRITGLIGGFILLTEILLMARLRWIDSWLGTYERNSWHRTLTATLITLTLTHTICLILAYAWTTKHSIPNQAWSMITTINGMTAATAATTILILAGLLSTTTIQHRTPYELWHTGLHTSLCAALFLAYSHQFAVGTTVIHPGPARWYWISLHILTISCLLWGRILRPAWFNARHDFHVTNITTETPGWTTIHIGGQHMEWVHAEVGQHLHCRFLTDQHWWQSHPFTITTPTNGKTLKIRAKNVGHYTQNLQHLEPGTEVLLSEATGCTTASRRTTQKALIIASDTGIAPIGPLLKELPTETILLYHTNTENNPIPFHQELEHLTHERNTTITYITNPTTDHWPAHTLSPAGIRELAPDITQRDVYVYGPRWLIKHTATTLRWLGVPRKQTHLESFEY
jgi:predicted ferric reductase